jgi:SSS family solute:Na+ symporter
MVKEQFVILLAVYAVVGTAIAVYVMRTRQSQEDYFIGSRAIGWLVSAMTYAATTYSAFMMVGLVGLAYATGVGAFIFEMAYLVATLVLLSIYGRRIWQLGKEKGFVSPMEMFSDRYGPLTGSLGAVVAFVALVPYTSVQVIGLALIFQTYEIGFTAGILIAAGIICIWALLGGLRGVTITDALQGLFMIALAVIAVVWSGRRFGGLELSTFPSKIWTPIFFINLTLPWCFFALTNPQVVQRLFIIREKRDFRKMLVLFGLFGFLYTTIVTVIGFSAKFGTLAGVFPQVADRDKVIVNILDQMSRWLALSLALTIIFAAVSTANSIILTLSSMLTRDLLRQTRNVWFGRMFIIVLTIIVVLFSLTRPNYLVELSVSSSRILMVFLPLFLGLFHLKMGGRMAGALTLVGGGAAAILFGALRLPLSSVWTLLTAFGLFFLGAALDGSSLGRAPSS